MAKNLELTALPLTPWRKIALGTWNGGGDPSVYGTLEINARRLVARQKAIAERGGERPPTITAIVATAVARVLKRHPEINALIRFGRIYQRRSVTLFLQAAADDDGKELSGVTINQAEDKSLGEVMGEIRAKAQAIRAGNDPNFKQVKSAFGKIPAFLVGFVMNLISFLVYTLNLDLSGLGLPRDVMGSVMITSIGSIGLDQAFVPLVPYSRVPLLIAVGALGDQVRAEAGEIVVVPVFKLCVTFDHRLVDGLHAAKMAKQMRRLLETDEGLDEVGLV